MTLPDITAVPRPRAAGGGRSAGSPESPGPGGRAAHEVLVLVLSGQLTISGPGTGTFELGPDESCTLPADADWRATADKPCEFLRIDPCGAVHNERRGSSR